MQSQEKIRPLSESPSNAPHVTHWFRDLEIARKLFHMSPGVLPFLLSATPHDDPLDFEALRFITIICVVATTLYIASARFVRRAVEPDFIITAVSYPGTILLGLLLFPAHVEFTCVVVIALAFGDGSAYCGGRLFGRRALPWNPQKTWAGLLSFIVVAGPLATLSYWQEARPAVPFGFAAICAGTAIVYGALAESLPLRITDNLRVGLASLIGVSAAYFALSPFWTF